MTFTYFINVHVRGGMLFNRLVHQKMEMVIIYSPCCARPIQTLIIFGTKIRNKKALFQALLFKNNLFNVKYVFHFTSHKRYIKGII